jgi:type IV secretory pathway VirB2 component (pilin)
MPLSRFITSRRLAVAATVVVLLCVFAPIADAQGLGTLTRASNNILQMLGLASAAIAAIALMMVGYAFFFSHRGIEGVGPWVTGTLLISFPMAFVLLLIG